MKLSPTRPYPPPPQHTNTRPARTFLRLSTFFYSPPPSLSLSLSPSLSWRNTKVRVRDSLERLELQRCARRLLDQNYVVTYCSLHQCGCWCRLVLASPSWKYEVLDQKADGRPRCLFFEHRSGSARHRPVTRGVAVAVIRCKMAPGHLGKEGGTRCVCLFFRALRRRQRSRALTSLLWTTATLEPRSSRPPEIFHTRRFGGARGGGQEGRIPVVHWKNLRSFTGGRNSCPPEIQHTGCFDRHVHAYYGKPGRKLPVCRTESGWRSGGCCGMSSVPALLLLLNLPLWQSSPGPKKRAPRLKTSHRARQRESAGSEVHNTRVTGLSYTRTNCILGYICWGGGVLEGPG